MTGAERPTVLPELTTSTHHGCMPEVGPCQRYGCRVHGPWRPSSGQRCNPQELLIDPYARAVGSRAVVVLQSSTPHPRAPEIP